MSNTNYDKDGKIVEEMCVQRQLDTNSSFVAFLTKICEFLQQQTDSILIDTGNKMMSLLQYQSL